MVNNKKVYSKLLLLIIAVLVLASTQTLAASISRVTGLKLKSVNTTEARISWNRVSNVTGYEVHVKTENGLYQNLGVVKGNNAKIINLASETTYYVKVRAYKVTNIGTSYGSFSEEVKITTKGNNSGNQTAEVNAATNLKLVNILENKAYFTWNKVTNATGYEVYIKQENGTYKNIGTVPNAKVTIRELQEGTTYYVKILAYRTANGKTTYAKNYSNEVKVTIKGNTDKVEIAQVTNLKSNNITKTTAGLTWNKVSNADGYEIYLRTDGKGFSSVGTTSNAYATLRTLESETTYTAKVRAYKKVNGKTIYGKFSDVITFKTQKNEDTVNPTPDITLGKITNLKTSNGTTTSVNLSWDVLSNANGYEIYLNDKSLGYTSKNSVRLLGLVEGKTYNIKVRAYKEETNKQKTYGEFSDVIAFVTPSEENLEAVTNLKVTTSNNQARLTWETVSGASGYEIYIRLPGQGYKSLGTIGNKNSVRIVSLTKGSNYSVKVRAYKKVDGKTVYGDFSNVVTFTAE